MATLRLYGHGNCCGAKIIDGFWDKDAYRNKYRRAGYDEQHIERSVVSSPDHVEVQRELKELLRQQRNIRGQFMVILNNDQNSAWQETLTNVFGFKLLYSDVANPNHSEDINSRLWTYIYVNRPYRGDRAAAGLPGVGSTGTPLDQINIPEPPPLPPLAPITIVNNTNYGVRI